MIDFKNMIEVREQTITQLFCFYELVKLGIVKFDMENSEHIQILECLINMVVGYKEEDYQDEPLCIQLERKNKFDVYRMIIVEILANSVRKVGMDNETNGKMDML